MKTAVIGSGTWGMALARLLFDNGHSVKVWSAIESEIKELREKRTHKNLPGIIFDEVPIFVFCLYLLFLQELQQRKCLRFIRKIKSL